MVVKETTNRVLPVKLVSEPLKEAFLDLQRVNIYARYGDWIALLGFCRLLQNKLMQRLDSHILAVTIKAVLFSR